jgi:hypothetical protein
MAHNTAKLGGAASDIVVAKVAVRCTNQFTAPLYIDSQHSLVPARAYEDDMDANAYPG